MYVINYSNPIRRSSTDKERVIDSSTGKPLLDDNGDYVMRGKLLYLTDDKGNLLKDDNGKNIPDYSEWFKVTYVLEDDNEVCDKIIDQSDIKMMVDQFKEDTGKMMSHVPDVDYELKYDPSKPFTSVDDEGNECTMVICKYGPPRIRRSYKMRFGKKKVGQKK